MGDPDAGRADVARLRRRIELAEQEDDRNYLFPPRGQRGRGVPLEITSKALAAALRVRDREGEAMGLVEQSRQRERQGDIARVRAIGEALVITAERLDVHETRLDDHETRLQRLEGRVAARKAKRSPADARKLARRLLGAGCSSQLAAKAMGVPWTTFRRLVGRGPQNQQRANDSAA